MQCEPIYVAFIKKYCNALGWNRVQRDLLPTGVTPASVEWDKDVSEVNAPCLTGKEQPNRS